MAGVVDLGERLEAVVANLVAEGRYPSRDKALQESVKLLEERERRRAGLDAALEAGMADIRVGRVKPGEEVFGRLEAKYRAMVEENEAKHG